MNFSTPVQCSDDVGANPSFQTGQEVPVADRQSPAQSSDLQTDAVRYDDRRAPPPPAAAAAQTGGGGGHNSDSIVITGKDGTITATGLAQALQPGAMLQLGHTNHMQVHHHKGGGSTVHFSASRPKNVANKFPITGSQAVPEERHLREVSKDISGEWQDLGRELQLRDAALDQVRMDYSVQGQLEVNYQMLRKWRETCYPVTVHALATAVAKIGRGDLADRLSQMG